MKNLKQIHLSRVFVPEAGGVDFFGHELSFFLHTEKNLWFSKADLLEKISGPLNGELDGISLFVYKNRVLYFFHVNNSTIYHWLGIDTNYSLGFRNFPGSLKKKWEKAEWAHLCTKLPILVMFGTRKVFRVNTKFITAKIQVVKTTIMSTSPAAQQIARSQQSRGLRAPWDLRQSSDRWAQAHRIHRTNGIFFVTY